MAPEPKEIARGIKRERGRSNVRADYPTSSVRLVDHDPKNDTRLSQGATLHEHLTALSSRDDGYLRIIPDGARKAAYYKWKFTRGEWAGHYVMAVVSYYDPAMALLLVRQKIDQVELGIKRPAKDRPHTD